MDAKRNRKRVRLPLALALATALLSAAAAHAQLPAFIPTPGVTPEGVAVDKTGDVYVSVRSGAPGTVPEGAIWKFTPDGQASLYANVGKGVIGGLAISANGDVYVAMATGPDRGSRRVSPLAWVAAYVGEPLGADGWRPAHEDTGTRGSCPRAWATLASS